MPTGTGGAGGTGDDTAGRTLPDSVSATALLTAAGGRGPITRAARVSAAALLTGAFLSVATTHPGATVVEAGLLTATGGRGPVSLSPRGSAAALLLTEGVRSGRVAAAGTTAPPFVVYQASLLAAQGGRGPVSFAARAVPTSLFTTVSGGRGAVAFAPRAGSGAFLAAAGRGPAKITAAASSALPDTRDPFAVLRTALLSLLKGSPMTFASTTLRIIDILAASYRVTDLTQMSARLAGATGQVGISDAIRGGDGVTDTTYGYGQDQPVLLLLPAAEAMLAAAQPDAVLKGIYGTFVQQLQSTVSKVTGFTSLNAYAAAQNAGAAYSFLMAPNFALINYLYNNSQASLLLSPGNVFAPQTLFGMASVGAGAVLTYTDLAQIPTANVPAAPPATVSQQGYTPAPGVVAIVSGAITGALTVTLTATGWDAGGNPVTGRTWTAVLTGAASGATVAFTPAQAGDRIAHITALAGAGTATAGTFNLQSVVERTVS